MDSAAGDLHVIHVAAVPQGLEDAVAEAEGQDVLHGFLTQVMIDAVDVGFVEDFVQAVAQLARAGQVVPEGLFDHQAPPALALAEPRRAEALRRRGVLAGLRGEIEHHAAAGLAGTFDLRQARGQARVEAGVADVARHIEQPLGEAVPHVGVEGGVFGELLDGFQHASAELRVGERRSRDAHDGETRRQPAVVSQAVEGRQELAPGEVAIGAEDDYHAFGHLALEAQRILEGILRKHRDQNSTRDFGQYPRPAPFLRTAGARLLIPMTHSRIAPIGLSATAAPR